MFASVKHAMFHEVISPDTDGSSDPSYLGPWKGDIQHCNPNVLKYQCRPAD